jgi:hypothetical protein
MFPAVRPVFVVSYSDLAFMQRFRRRTHSYLSAPDWVFDDEQVRRVVAAHVAILARVTTIPEDLTMLRLLNRRAIKLLRKSDSWEFHQLARAAQSKGLPAYYASMIYKTYRLGFNSVQCAKDLGVSPPVVRRSLHTMKIIVGRMDGNRVRWYYRPRKKKKAEHLAPAPGSAQSVNH